MKKRKNVEFKKKYQIFRHHAWAGLGFLSVVLAFRIIFFKSAEFLTPIIVILGIYIIIALVFTYRFRSGLSSVEQGSKIDQNIELEKEKINAKKEKDKLKLEKKRSKNKLKKEKNSSKK